MKTVIYARKSRGTIEELNSQVSICKDYCDRNNYVVSEVKRQNVIVWEVG